MDHADHVSLLRPAIPQPAPNQTWADIGAGDGAFTLALANLLGPGAQIIAVDRDRGALLENSRRIKATYPATQLTTIVADFGTRMTELPQLEGLVAANSLHFVSREEQIRVIAALAAHLSPGGTFVVVEYDDDSGNPWVPHPFSAESWPALAEAAGLVDAQTMGRVPSRFLGAIYSASAHTPRD